MKKALSLLAILALLFVSIACEETGVTSLTLSQSRAKMEIGETLSLRATISPANAIYDGIMWTSASPSIADVSESGQVTALSEGNTTVTAIAGGKTARCIVEVVRGNVAVTAISLNKTTLDLIEGETETLVATITPKDATNKNIVWSSDAPAIARVDVDGTVSALNNGTAVITASAGDETASCSVSVTSLESVIEQEREALIAFYQALDGDNWENNTNWCSNRPVSEWYGIYTTANGMVSRICFSGNGLNGTITSDMLAFRELWELFLEANWQLQIELTDEKPLWFNSLKRFDVFYCKPLSYLPEWFYEMPAITRLEMDIDRIPSEIGQMKSLTGLRLNTKPTVPIPDEIGQLLKLKELCISGSFMSSGSTEDGGPIPASLGNLKLLETLEINHMNCSGSIPPLLFTLYNLKFFFLGSCHLSGEIPSELGKLTELHHLSLANNRLTGSLPESICNLTNLHLFDIANNDLSGELPANMGQLFNSLGTFWYTDFNIADNHFTGKIPESILSHPKWKYLWYPFIATNNFDIQGVTIPGPDIKGKDIFGNTVDSDQIYKNNRLTILYQYSIDFGDSRVYFPHLPYVKDLFNAYKDKSVSIIAWGDEAETVDEDIAFVHQYGLEDWIFLNAYQRYVNRSSSYPDFIHPHFILIDNSGNLILDSTRLKTQYSYDEISTFIKDYLAGNPL